MQTNGLRGFAATLATWMLISGAMALMAQTTTTTTLSMSAGASSLQSGGSLVWGGVLTLQATISNGSTPVTLGLVNFCDATAAQCTDVHVLGSSQLTSAGTAVFKFRPGQGTHSYKAVFVGTNSYATSSSASQTLTLTAGSGQYPTDALLSNTGTWGNYTLTATVEDFGATSPLTGGITIEDTSNGNAPLATAPLGPSTPGLFWATQAPCTNAVGSNYIAAADFNGDGYLDFATIEASLNEVLIFDYQPNLGCYEETGSYTAGSGPDGIYLADFNGDGIPDIVIPDASTYSITILLGNGDGTFKVSSLATSHINTYIAIADFNGDGIPDLAVADEFDGGVSIYLGNGDGTFTAAASLTTSSSMSLATGDFNGDGNVDIAVAVGSAVDVFLGNGDGTFKTGPTLAVITPGNTWAGQVVAADFNGDGKQDLAVSVGINQVPSPGTITVFLGNGDGTFNAAAKSSVTPDMPLKLAVVDFNQDRIPDLAELDFSGNISVLIGKGDGTFNSPPLAGSSLGSSFYQSFGVGDMDGDGRPDLLYAGSYPPNLIVVYFGLTKPMETASTAPIPVELSGVGQHLVVANYAGDAYSIAETSSPLTLVGIPPASTTTLALTANGAPASTVAQGTAVTLTATVLAAGLPATKGQVNFCDATAASCTDIYLVGSAQLASNGTAVLKMVPGAGNHSYKAILVESAFGAPSQSATVPLAVTATPVATPLQTTTTISASGSPYTLTATVEGTGSTTAATGNVSFVNTSYANAVLATAPLGLPTPGIAFQPALTAPFTNVDWLQMAAGDFNGDGIEDIAVVNPYTTTLTILIGKGDGTFTESAGYTGTAYLNGVVAGDFNGDGKLDLAVSTVWQSSTNPGQLLIFLGNGNGAFTAVPNAVPSAGYGTIFAAADFNGDGKLDLILNNQSTAQIMFGDGDGTFTTGPTDANAAALAVGDLNGDGIPDVVAGQTNGGSAQVMLGKGDGTFTAIGPTLTGGGTEPYAGPTVIADFNGDGIPDLAIVASNYSAPVIYLGKGDGTFTAAPGNSYPSINEPMSIVAVDLNHDGKTDLAISNGNAYSGNSSNPDVAVLLGNGDGTFTSVVGDTQLNGTGELLVGGFGPQGAPGIAVESGQGVSTMTTLPTVTQSATASNITLDTPAPNLVAASYAGDSNYASSISSTTYLGGVAATPVIAPASGTYNSLASITITEASPGATIYYYGTGALSSNGYVQYTGPIPVYQNGPATLQAYASGTGLTTSSTATATYTFNLPVAAPPIISPSSGVYPGPQTATITAQTGTTILYSLSGLGVSLSSSQYTDPLSISTSETLSAMAGGGGYAASKPVTAQYIIASSPGSFIYTVAGTQNWGYLGDGGIATIASLGSPRGSAVDSAGNIFIADSGNNVVRKVAAGTGIITTVVGNGSRGYSGDGGPATSAQLDGPIAITFDSAGNLYIADEINDVIREVAAGTGIISTIAGNPSASQLGDGGPATSAQLQTPFDVAVDSAGNIYIASFVNRVRKVTAGTGIITTVAGNGNQGYTGDGVLATSTSIYAPEGVAVDSAGNLYIADTGNSLIRKVTVATGIISTVAGRAPSLVGQNTVGYYGDGGPATSAGLNNPEGITFDSAGNLYIADTVNDVIREVTASSGIINTVAGTGFACTTLSGDGGPANQAALCNPAKVSVDRSGNLFVPENIRNRIREITAPALPPVNPAAAPVFSLQSGTYPGTQKLTITDSTPGAEIYISFDGSTPLTTAEGYHGPISVTASATISAVAVAPGYLTSSASSASYTITTPPPALISTVALAGAGSPVITPNGVAFDSSGNLYFADYYGMVVWKVVPATGAMTVVAGRQNQYCATQAGVLATSTCLQYPSHVAFDAAGNLYIANSGASTILMVSANTGLLSIYAGGYCCAASYGDGGPATSALLSIPEGITFDSSGNLYIADNGHGLIRMVSAATGNISTVAGTVNPALTSLGDGGPATSARLAGPVDVAIDKNGNLYIADLNNLRVRMVAAGTGIITTVAGNGQVGVQGDGGPALSAAIDPEGLAVDASGNLYLSSYPDSIREVVASSGVINTIAGNGYLGYSGDGGAATMAELSNPTGLAFDPAGNLSIAAYGNNAVRKITFLAPAPAPTFSLPAGTYHMVQSVSIADSITGAAIYYTTDGTTPTTASTLYSAPVSVSANETLQAIAVAAGYAESPAASVTYTVQLPVAPTITWAAPAAIIYGTALGATQLNATASVPGTFSYSPVAGTVLNAGTQTLSATFTPTDTIDYSPTTATVQLTVTQAVPAITWATPSAILYGTALSSTQLNATANVPGTFLYTPASGTLLPVGSDTLSVVFTPTNANDYASATDQVTIVVNQPTVIISSLSPAFGGAGGVAFTLTVNGSGFTQSSSVTWNGSALNTTFVSATQLTAQVPATDIANAGTITLTVQNSTPGSTSNSFQFEVDSAGSSSPVFSNPSATVTHGATASYPVTLPSGATNVSVTCLNLPAGATCSYSASNSAVSITTSSATPVGTYAITVVFTETLPGAAAALLLPLLVLPLSVAGKRRAARRIWLALCVFAILGVAAIGIGCGGSGSTLGGGPVQQTHQATSSAAITLIVQ